MKRKEYWQQLVVLLFAGWAAIWIYRSMLSPVYEEIQGTIGRQSNTAMGLIASCYFLGYTLLQIPAGMLVRRLGQKKVIVPGFLVFALGTLLTALAGNLYALYGGSLIAGAGCGTFYGAAFSLTARHVPAGRKGVSAAMVNSGCCVGLIAGLIGSGLLVKAGGLFWQGMAFVSLAVTLLVTVLFAFFIRPTAGAGAVVRPEAEQDDRRGSVAGVPKGRQPEPVKPAGKALGRQFAACCLLYFATCYVYYLIITWLPDFLSTERGINDSLLGVVSALISVTAVPGGIFFAGLSDRKKDKKGTIIVFLEVMSVLLVLLAMQAPGVGMLSAVLLLYGFFGKIAVDPVLISLLSDQVPEADFSVALGIFNCFGMSASVIAPVITGGIKDLTASGAGGFYLGALVLGFGILGFMVLNKKRRGSG